MNRNKYNIYLAIFIISVIALTAFSYIQTQEKNSYGIFPEKLGDMTLALYREGAPAITEVKNLHQGQNLGMENAYIAYYRSKEGNKAKLWVSESKNDERAASALAAMSSRVGTTGMFSDPTVSTIEGIPVYFVTGPGGYHYFYAKDKRVFWIQINNPNKDYQLNIVKEAIKNI